jgi:ATP-dependent helicase HrpB
MAARTLATYMAKCLGGKVGEIVGYQVKDDKKISSGTRLEILTEGILTKRLQSNPELEGIGLIIFDEFHERSVNADLSLMLTLEIQQFLREDLRILVMSATLDTELISKYLGDAPVQICSGRAYPVDISYRKIDKKQLAINVCKAINDVIDDAGNVLVFLPGIAEITKCITQAKIQFSESYNLKFLPLHGSLSLQEQEIAIDYGSSDVRKIIFTTNIAETSLTIEGVTCVIDSGLEKTLTFNPSSGMSKLTTTKISKASAEQRKGRAGRLSAGRCIRLWSEAEHLSLIDYQQEEITNADLANVVLELARCNHTEYEKINWLTPPPKAHFNSTQDLLKKLELLDPSGNINLIGKQACNLPVHPRLSKMMLSANNSQELELACIMSALLSERDIVMGRESADLIIRIFAVIERSEGNSNYIKPITLRNVMKDIAALKTLLKHKSMGLDESYIPDIAAYLLLQAFPERLAKRRSPTSSKYQLANGKGVYLDESDPLNKDEFLVVNDCDAQQKEGRVYSAVGFNINILFDKFESQISDDIEYVLTPNKSNIQARRLKKYGNIVLEETRSNDVPQELIFDSIKAILKFDAKSILNWTGECDDWLKRVIWLGGKIDNFPALTEKVILNTSNEWLLPYISNVKKISDLKQIKIFPLLSSILSYEEKNLLEKEAPTVYLTPDNKRIPIVYDINQGPTVSVVLQEVFGELQSPKLAGKSVPLRFELLSPARRPIQITSDLANFWIGSYANVAKDMRARYPRHRWPVDPLSEQAGYSIKKRKNLS